MDIKTILLKGRRWLWLPVVLTVIGAAAGWTYASRIVPSPYAVVTLISLDIDRAAVFGMEMSLEEVVVSRRMATELMGIIKSSRVTRLASRYLSDGGYNLPYGVLASMTTIEPETQGSGILILKVSAYNPALVIDAANAMAIAFVDTLYEYTGTVYVSVLDYADRVYYTAGGNRTLYGGAGAIGGAAIGAVIIYLLILSDNRIKTIEDVKRINGVSKVSIIPLHHIK